MASDRGTAFRAIARRVLVSAAFLGFACRAWIPAGYMPAAPADGGPIVFCPGGSGGALVAMLAARQMPGDAARADGARADAADPMRGAHAHALAHVHHHSSHDRSHGGGDDGHAGFDAHYCPLGVTAASAALAQSFDVALLELSFPRTAVGTASPAAQSPLRAYDSRAPPSV
ncbi:MAG TPA: hypothetical protein VFV10_19540 [Gammaproteobacteria bacterium]|nr:hypothetical protein [Gammaproteobacteria bacterium]